MDYFGDSMPKKCQNYTCVIYHAYL